MRIVAPFAGAWIEIAGLIRGELYIAVAPFAGAWIEISLAISIPNHQESLPSRERGLKLLCLAGWHITAPRRSLRGSVD